MQIYDFATHTHSLSNVYQTDVDFNFNFKGSKNTNQQGINVFLHNALLSARDVAINNYSSLILTNEMPTQEAFQVNSLPDPEKRIISTYLAISIVNEINDQTRFLYFNNERETDSLNFNAYTSHQMLPLSEIVNEEQRYFNVELIDKQYARINYKYNNRDYYLAANTQYELLFVSSDVYKNFNDLIFNFIDETIFFYVLDEPSNTLFLQKPLANNVTRALGLSALTSNKLQLLSATIATNYFAFNTFNFKIRPNISNISSKLNTSWIRYNVNDIDNLDVDVVSQDLSNNILIASQYVDATTQSIPSRPLILKNQHSLMSNMDECSYTELQDGRPGPQLRQYTSIFSGNEQERGNDAIALNYTIYSNDYVAKPDAYTLFKTSDDLYPYTQLNINDSTLVSDGALGGNIPYTSDQLFMQKNAAQGQDGQYLCTWLSGGMWVDRYYNNNKMTPADAAKAVNAIYGTYENYVQQLLQNEAADYDFFDKKSDFVFEPDKEYYYYRMGNKRLEQQLKTYSDNLLLDSLQWKTSSNQLLQTANEYACNGSSFAIFENYEKINDASQITLSMWLDSNDWSNIQAHEIVGNVAGIGFGIIKDPIVTPLIMMQSSSAVHIFNSDFVEITKTLLSGAKFLQRVEALDDFYAVDASGTMYEMQCDATLYDKRIFAENIIATTNDNQIIYKLHDDGTTVTSFDAFSEQVSSFAVDNFSKSIICIDGTVYGFAGTKVLPYTTNAVLFLYNQNQIVYKNYATNDQFVAFKTLSSTSSIGFISDFALDDELNMYILHNDYKLSKFNREREFQFTTSIQNVLSATNSTNFAVDICYEYISGKKIKSIIVAASDSNNKVSFAKFSEFGSLQNFTTTNVTKLSNAVFNITGAQYLQTKHANRGNNIDFVVKLPNYYNNLDVAYIAYTFDASKFKSGTHHLALRIDGRQGNVSFFVDGQLKKNVYIDAAKYMQLPLLQTSICFGTTQFSNGTTLSKFLQQQNAYYANGITMSYPRIYNAALQDNDIKLLYMQKNSIKSLNFHLPCGQRNNLDKIKHMFAWGTPGFKSNNIEVVVKNSGILTTTTQQAIKNQIMQEIKQVMPTNTSVMDIKFVEFD